MRRSESNYGLKMRTRVTDDRREAAEGVFQLANGTLANNQLQNLSNDITSWLESVAAFVEDKSGHQQRSVAAKSRRLRGACKSHAGVIITCCDLAALNFLCLQSIRTAERPWRSPCISFHRMVYSRGTGPGRADNSVHTQVANPSQYTYGKNFFTRCAYSAYCG